MNEFEIIEKYFLKLTEGKSEALSLKDDAALLNIPNNHNLVVSIDTLCVGTHVFEDATPEQIAHKAIRTNLSDLAAMGATPYTYQLCLTLPEPPSKKWLKSFTKALLENQSTYNIFCSGGDTTRSKGALSVTLSAFGLVKSGTALKRNGAKENDKIALSGPIGNALIGYHILKGNFTTQDNAHFIDAYYRPKPQIKLGKTLIDTANSAIDISDGLAADLTHIAKASNLSAHITLSNDLFSPQALKVIEAGYITREELITGGDDYQLLFSVPEDKVAALLENHPHIKIIGDFKAGDPTLYISNEEGKNITLKKAGWSHF